MSHMMLGHEFAGIANRTVDINIDEGKIQQRAYRRFFGIEPSCESFSYDVRFGHNADDLACLCDEDRADPFLR